MGGCLWDPWGCRKSLAA
jgi:hypothetical protein